VNVLAPLDIRYMLASSYWSSARGAAERIFAMPSFSAPDGTDLAYHVFGGGIPVICLPGGPMQDSVYLGELGSVCRPAPRTRT
jgi:hypothetical protein